MIPFLDELTFQKVTGGGLRRALERVARRGGRRAGAEAARPSPRAASRRRGALTTRGIRQYGARFSPAATGSPTRAAPDAVPRESASCARRLRRPPPGAGATAAPRWPGRRTARAWCSTSRQLPPLLHGFDLCVVRRRERPRAPDHARPARAEPDVSPDGRGSCSCGRRADRSELALIGLDGQGLRDLTRSEPGVQWSNPALAPDGAAVVASRWTAGGWLDLVRVDPATGAFDRADARPGQRRGAGVHARRRRGGLPLRPRRRVEPVRAAPRRTGACGACPACSAAPSRPTSAPTAGRWPSPRIPRAATTCT